MDIPRTRDLLQKFEFKTLFIEELGWDRHTTHLEIPVDGQTVPLTAVAEKRGMVAFLCSPFQDGRIPDYPTRRKIEAQVAKSVHEHLIIYADGDGKANQVWQWVKREAGKPAACREHAYHRNQSGEALIQKLQAIAFSLEEEESLTLFGVVSRTRAGFDIERVTRKFYDRFKAEHAAFLKFLKGIPEEEMQRWYVSVMLNRLMFIYFIQKKNFLDNDPNYLRSRLAQSKKGGKNLFYKDFLCPLFFEGFAKRESERSSKTNALLGQVPYLNGGLFLRHQIEEMHGKDIQIPDVAFEKLFDFFDQYQWHLDERPLRDDREINPDVLGYIFEKYINQKQMGAYYTKEDITEYISKNTVIPFLFDAARQKCKIAFEGETSVWRLLQADPDRYIYDAVKKGVDLDLPPEIAAGLDDVSKRAEWNRPAPSEYALPTEIWREVVARRRRYEGVRARMVNGEIRSINDLITCNLDLRQFAQDVIETCEGPELLRAFYHAIEKVTVLDPTCGSGAFLFAALNILEPLYQACLDRMQVFLDELERSGEKHRPEKFSDFRKVLERVEKHPNLRYFILKSIVVNNLYGVDIMDEAVEICKLRLFLKLVAQVEGVENIEPLPDIDFNVRAGNTLVGFASLDEVRKAMEGDMIKLLSLPAIEEKAQDVDRLFSLFREMQTKHNVDAKEFLQAKRGLGDRLRVLEDELNRHLAAEYGVDPRKKGAYEMWLTSHKPFHWFIEFYGILKSGGFDVIIGNPPYVEYKEVKEHYQVRGYKTEECGNLYAFTWERSVALGHRTARIGLIIPVGSVCTDGYASLQNLWLSNGSAFVSNFSDRPGKLFDGLEHIRLAIILLAKRKEPPFCVHTTGYTKWFSEAREWLFPLLCYAESTSLIRSGSIPKIRSEIESSILKKVSASRKSLLHFLSPTGRRHIYYTRKLSWFVQILDFVPSIIDKRGRKREPSELKEEPVATDQQRDAYLCVLNSTLFYWLLTVWSDCRNLNKREVVGVPFDFDALDNNSRDQLSKLAAELMKNFRKNSKILEMNYKNWGLMRIQCIYPKFAKPIIDEMGMIFVWATGSGNCLKQTGFRLVV